jgi:VanZ family protein
LRHTAALWLPVILCMSGIFIASSLSNPPLPAPNGDVWLHAAAYFGLTVLLIRAFARGTWQGVTSRSAVLAFVAAVAYGASDEWHQSFVAHRHAEFRDLRADAIGAAVAAIGAWACGIIRRL